MQSPSQTVAPQTISVVLASFIHQARPENIPENIRHQVRRALMNYFAVSLAGCNDPTLDIAVRTYARFDSGKTSTIIGRPERTDLLNAAALNAMSANVYDFDDTHIPTIIHPTAPVAAALFAMSESDRITGEQLMLAFLLGVEVECRIGAAISPFHYDKGWHITSTCGVFGSSMAIGKVRGLTLQQLVWALGSSACQAGGLVESLGTMSKSVSVGNAARNGIVSAFLAEADFTGPSHPLEGKNGFLHVFCDSPELGSMVSGLGDTWEIDKVAYKPYPCGVVLNPVLDACLELHSRIADRSTESIRAIELTGHPLLRKRTDRPGVSTGRESQVSAQHAAPVALVRGRAGLEEFSDEAVHDPVLRRLGTLVRFRDDPDYSINSAKVEICFDDGSIISKHIDVARGALERPLTDEELETKLREASACGGSGCDTGRLIDAIWHVDKMPDVGDLVKLAMA